MEDKRLFGPTSLHQTEKVSVHVIKINKELADLKKLH